MIWVKLTVSFFNGGFAAFVVVVVVVEVVVEVVVVVEVSVVETSNAVDANTSYAVAAVVASEVVASVAGASVSGSIEAPLFTLLAALLADIRVANPNKTKQTMYAKLQILISNFYQQF